MEPKIKVRLTGRDGNAFVLIGAVSAAAKKAKMPKETLDAILEEAMSGDYDHLLATFMEHFEVS